MRFHVRVSLPALIAGSILALSASPAQAVFGVERFFASNCKATAEKCGETSNPGATEAKEQDFTEAAGHPPFGVTHFALKRKEIVQGLSGQFSPEGNLKNLRIDVSPGVSTNPQAVEKCSVVEFTSTLVLAEKGLYKAPKCPAGSEIGKNIIKTVLEIEAGAHKGEFEDKALEGTVYNLVQPAGRSSYFGVAIQVATGLYAHTFIEGHVEWAGDYHDYFEIKNITKGLLESRLIFKGNIGTGGFLTNPTSCTGTGPQTTTSWHGEGYEKETASASYTTLVGTEECGLVPFAPGFSLTPETTKTEEPDGITTEVTLPHNPGPNLLDSSQLKIASVTLPEGMTLNESAAHGLEACTPAQARIHSLTAGVACPEGSKIGTVTLNVPGLPAESLKGNLYLGGPESGPITGPPYIVYLDTESEPYGLSIRLKGETTGNETSGRLTTVFKENPEQPFSTAILHVKGGPLSPLANPLVCGSATTEGTFTPFTGTPSLSLTKAFTVDANGKEGACSSPLPFSLTQSTENQTANAGAHTNFTFNLVRPGGDQYISKVRTTLPAGLVGAIPTATRCPEPQASEGACPPSSQIGTATVEAGSGPTPFTFSGPVYLTGPYNGAPFGLSVAIAAVAGPFNLGTVVTRATISVDPHTARVIVEATLPRIVKAVGRASSGILLRVRKMSVAVNKQGFLLNPTNCGALASESTVTAFTLAGGGNTATQSLSTPFQVGECGRLPFKPSFKAASNARTSKANGASLETTINQGAGQANIKSVTVQLPIQLPSRLTTLQQACLEATFATNPLECPKGSFVGGGRANTPVLASKLTGPAILVSHANAAFPDLDLVLEAEGVRVILVGNTDIKKGITTTTFAANPDVPVSSVTVNLPAGPHSALGANANLCANPLIMPTTITGQNGKTIKQNTRISVKGCGVRIVGHKVVGNVAYLTVQTFAGGRISGSGPGLSTVFRRLRYPTRAATLKVRLSPGGQRRRRPFRTRVRVGFVPLRRGPSSAASVVLSFR